MSYDLAVWEGNRPADDAAARAEYRHLYDRYLRSRKPEPPTTRIAAYVRALLDRYPDIDSEAGEGSPWATGPLMREASGSLLYVAMVYSKCEEVSAWAAQLAHRHGLVCYDLQTSKVRP